MNFQTFITHAMIVITLLVGYMLPGWEIADNVGLFVSWLTIIGLVLLTVIPIKLFGDMALKSHDTIAKAVYSTRYVRLLRIAVIAALATVGHTFTALCFFLATLGFEVKQNDFSKMKDEDFIDE